MPLFAIADPADPRLAEYAHIPDPELLERHGLFVAEGRLVVRRLLEGRRHRVLSVLVTEPARAALDDLVAAVIDTVPVYVVPLPVMTDVTGFNIHRGCLALAERPPLADAWALAAGAVRLVVLERVANADNVGSIFRNAAAFGVDAVLLGPACADPLYRKAIRTSMGAALALPFARAEPWPGVLHALREGGFHVIGLTPSAHAPPLDEAFQRLGPRARVAILLGHEGDGLSPAAAAECSSTVSIPMAEGVDSLNVATAGAIAMYALRTVMP